MERRDGTELSFAGLMTRSGEESFEQGRKALLSRVRAADAVVARGTSSGSTIRTWIDNIALSPECDWSNVNAYARRRTAALAVGARSGNFLGTGRHIFARHARRGALRPGRPTRKFIHAGKFYWLETQRQPEHPLEIAGTIRDLNGARRAEFRTAYAAGDESGIPMRIEYRPRSFLRLTFEAELEATQPAIHSLFHQGADEEESA